MRKKPNVLYLLYITAAFAAAILIVSAAGKHELNIYTENTFEAGFTLECPEGVSAEIGQGPAEEGHGHFYVRPGGVDEHFPVSVSDPEHPERREIHPLRVDRFGVVHDEFTGNFSNCRLISALITIYVFACAAGLFIGFRRQTKYSIFSYNSVMYMGFGIFVLTIGITLAYGLAGTFRAPADVTMHTIYMMILNSAVNFLVISTPFLIVFAVLMIVSNLSLIRHEGKRLVNVLGIIVSVFFLGTDLLVVRYGRVYLAGAEKRLLAGGINAGMLAANLAAAVYLYAECMLIGAVVASLLAAHMMPAFDKDYIIILGCGIRKDGTPTPLLKGRCDRAIEFRNRQVKERGKDLVFVTSGGKGNDEIISESECMRNYLVSQGISPQQILMEDRSSSTTENMRFSKQLIGADTETAVAFSTTRYHVFRSGILARRSGMKAAQGCGAKTKWYFWPNAWVREFLGLMTSHVRKQIIVLAGTIAVYAALSVLLGS